MYKKELAEQLAYDYCCSVEDVLDLVPRELH